MTLTVALVGRPNVGKSTLFNRLVGKPQALVADEPGLTRDWQEGIGHIGDLTFKVIDTAGFEDEKKNTLAARMWAQSKKAAQQADVIFFMTDGREGLTRLEQDIAQFLRIQNKPVFLLANKCEGKSQKNLLSEAYELGFDSLIPISAAHGQGMVDLYEALIPYIEAQEKEAPLEEGIDKDRPITLTIVGRPNAGKSTLVNSILKEERLLTGPEAGITRDAIAVPFSYKGQAFTLIDTAGLRRKARVVEYVEKQSTHDTMEAIKYAQGVVLLMDATHPLEKQDLTIAHHVIEEGRMLLLVLNKWDLVENPKEVLDEIQYQLSKHLPQVKGIPCLPLSALKGKGIMVVFDAILQLNELWNKKISTGDLNRWLDHALQEHAPPAIKGRRLKIKYMTQTKTRPPTFLAFSNMPASQWPRSYERYLLNSLRQAFDMPGVPLRLAVRTSENPYTNASH